MVRDQIKETLAIILKQTGHVRPCKILADKDTTKHRTHQLISKTSVFPDVKDLIQTIYIDYPLIKHHTSKDIAVNIVNSVKEYIPE